MYYYGGKWLSDFVLYLLQKLKSEDIRHTGEGYEARCPFHKGTSRNFRVNNKGLFFCHNVDCGITGNIVHLCKLALGVNYSKVVKILKEQGMPIITRTKTEFQLPSLTDIVPYRSYDIPYLIKRGYFKEHIKLYDIVYNPTSNTILFPVYDTRGTLTSTVIRKPGPKQIYKQLNGVEKSTQIFGLYQCIRGNYEGIMITEGHADPLGAIQLESEYFPVAIGGCYLSEDQSNKIVANSNKQCIALDNDKEGTIGTYYAIQRLRKSGSTDLSVLVYTAGDPGEIPRTQNLKWDFVKTVDWLKFHHQAIQEHLFKRKVKQNQAGKPITLKAKAHT